MYYIIWEEQEKSFVSVVIDKKNKTTWNLLKMVESGGHQIPPETGTTPAEAYQVGFDITIFVSNYVYILFIWFS